MTKHYIHDNETGEPMTDSEGRPLFYSDDDGDWDPERQTVYREDEIGNTKIPSMSYNEKTGKISHQ